jgi:hypothetical protein
MAIVTRQARKADFETILKPTIRASSYISINDPLAIAVYNGSAFEFDEGGIVRPTGIQSEEAFGSPQVKYNQPVFPDGIASEEAFGAAVLNAWIQPTGISSAEAFGTPQVPQIIICGGIASGEAWGSPVLRYDQHITATGISSGELFGTSLLKWQRTEMLPSAPGLRFGMKKLTNGGSFKMGMKSVFGLRPVESGECSVLFVLTADREEIVAEDFEVGNPLLNVLLAGELCGKTVSWAVTPSAGITADILSRDNSGLQLEISACPDGGSGQVVIRASAGRKSEALTIPIACPVVPEYCAIVDTFTDADNTELQYHISDSGGIWSNDGVAYIMNNAVIAGRSVHSCEAHTHQVYAEATIIVDSGIGESAIDVIMKINSGGSSEEELRVAPKRLIGGVLKDQVYLKIDGVTKVSDDLSHSAESVYRITRTDTAVIVYRDDVMVLGYEHGEHPTGQGHKFEIEVGNPFWLDVYLDNYNAGDIIPT